MDVIYVENTNSVFLRGLHDSARTSDTVFINDATVRVTLLDENDDEIAGQSWPVTMSYVSGSDGDYKGLLSNGLSITAETEGTAVVEVISGSSRAKIRRPVRFEERTG